MLLQTVDSFLAVGTTFRGQVSSFTLCLRKSDPSLGVRIKRIRHNALKQTCTCYIQGKIAELRSFPVLFHVQFPSSMISSEFPAVIYYVHVLVRPKELKQANMLISPF